jgi:hypothetical protein
VFTVTVKATSERAAALRVEELLERQGLVATQLGDFEREDDGRWTTEVEVEEGFA